jgi:tetratricopeptide (TPR) repeat protein
MIMRGREGASAVFTLLVLLLFFSLGLLAGYVYAPQYLGFLKDGGVDNAAGKRGAGPRMERGTEQKTPPPPSPPGPSALTADGPAPAPLAGFKHVDEIAQMYKAGDFRGAVDLLRKELALDPGSPEKEAALAKGLNFLAVNKYENGEFNEAEGILKEAVGLLRDPAITKNLAMAQAGAGKYMEAAGTLSAIPDDPDARRLLKDLYVKIGDGFYRQGEIASALTYLDKGLVLDPSDSFLKEAVARVRAERNAEGGMTRKEGGHFVIKFDGAENAVAGHLIGLLLEEAYYKVGSDLGYYPEDRLEAVLYSKAAFKDVTRSPSWAGALYDGRIKIPAGGLVEKTKALERVIFHEYTHALVHRLSRGMAPTWLNEGLAQYEEGNAATWQTDEAAKGLADDPGVSLRRLEGSFTRLSPDGALRAYLASLSATRYLINEFGTSSVVRVLEGLGAGKTLDEALYSAIFLKYEDFERSWLEHLRR